MSKPNHIEGEGELRLSLPWPDKLLSPNARCHWGKKAKAVRMAREGAAWLVISTRKSRWHWPNAAISMKFNPPDRRRRDLDNIIASMKGPTDGIADALGVDDSKFQITYSMGSPVKGGSVEVTIARAA